MTSRTAAILADRLPTTPSSTVSADAPWQEVARLRPVLAAGAAALVLAIILGASLGLPPVAHGALISLVAALVVVVIVANGLPGATGQVRTFRLAVLTATAAWLVLQATEAVGDVAGVSFGLPVEYLALGIVGAVAVACWRIALGRRLESGEIVAVHLDSAAIFLTVAAVVLLVLGGPALSEGRDSVLLVTVALLLGVSASLPVLWLAVTPVRGFHGWLAILAGMPVLCAGMAWRAIMPSDAIVAAEAVSAIGALLVGYGTATWTARADPSGAFRAVALRMRATFPLATLAVAPVLLVVNELRREVMTEVVSMAIDLAIAGVLAIVIVRQTVLLRERGRLLAQAEIAADRERGLVEGVARSERRFRSLVQHSSDVFLIVDLDGTVTYQSPAIRGVLGYTAEERTDGQIFEFVHPDDARFLRLAMAELAVAPQATRTVEVRVRHADGSWRNIEATARNMIDDEVVGGIVVNYRDVTERRTLEEQLRHSAFHDPLTGLANRALFVDRAQHALSRRGTRLAVLFMDLDDFKIVNDSFGHAAGDQVLTAVASRLTAALRAEDTVSRLGGDEFAVLVEDTDARLAETVAGRILDALRPAFEVSGKQVHLATSIGIALSGSETRTADELLRNADVAMYMAKGRGKGRLEIFEASMHAAVLARLELKADLERAVERDELRLRYQPVYDLRSGRLVGFEALLRWRHPHRGEVLPGDFVPLAEETGLIVPIGRHVLSEAAKQAQAWNAGFDDPVYISVNVSPRQLREPTFTASVREILDATCLPPGQLILELTETGLMQDDEGELRELKELGVHLALDDFGTGYSSLSYLSSFPIDVLKVDQSFVGQLAADGSEPPLVRSVLQLGQAMGLYTVAEGIEHPHQLARLRELGVTYGQGFLLARPLDPIAATRLIGEQATIDDLLAS